ncbi:MAG: GumC family protein [Ignavibacteriales bacterium]
MDQAADELDLLEIFGKLWAGKWIIVGITVVAMVVAAVLSFFVLRPVYEAKATLIVVALAQRTQKETEELLSISALQKYLPNLSLESYRQQVVNPVVLGRVRQRLGLQDSVEELTRAVQARSLKDTNLIEVVTKYTNPETAAAISNAVVEEYERYLSEVAQKQMTTASVMAEQQLEVEEKKLEEAIDEYMQFLKEARPVSEIEEEIEAKSQLLTQYRSELVKIEVQTSSVEAFIRECSSELENQPSVLTTTKSILDDPLMQEVAGEQTGTSLTSLAGLRVKSEEINTVHMDLASDLAIKRSELAGLTASKAAVSRAVADLERNLEALRLEYAEREVEEQRLTTKVDTLRSVYLAFLEEYEKAKVGEAIELGQASISMVSQAEKPERPVAPRKMLNVAVAGVLGGMLSVFVVLVMSWDKRAIAPGSFSHSAS